ncbi:APC family permease [Fusobacterium sp. PH5-44]|uniref:APC family permease n=1 Tax=unclassified Fusobacterium TaxID=2648384 RepID=UPI003D21DD5F
MGNMNNNSGLKLKDLTSLAAGQVIGAGVVTLVGQAIGVTGRSVWLAYATAILMGFCIILPYILLSSMIRVKGGNYTLVATVLGNKSGGMYGMAFILNILACGMFGLAMGFYLQSILPWVPVKPAAIITVTLFWLANIAGMKFISKIQNIMTICLMTGLGLFIVMGLFKLQPGTFNFSSPDFFTNGSDGFFKAVLMLVFSCTGHAFVVSYSKEAQNPKRDVPLAIIFATVIIFLLYTIIAIVASGILPIKEVAGRPLTDVAKDIMSRPLAFAFVVGGPIMALATTLNSSFGAFSRPFLQMTNDGWFPKSWAKLTKDGSPYMILTVLYALAIMPILFGLNIQSIVGNVVFIGRFADLLAISAVMLIPSRLPDAWENRYFRISKSVFYILMILSMCMALFCIGLSMRSITKMQVIVTVSMFVIFGIYLTIREKTGSVKMEKSYELQ